MLLLRRILQTLTTRNRECSSHSEGTPEGDKEMRRPRRFMNIMRKRLKTSMSKRMETIMSRERTMTTMREGGWRQWWMAHLWI